MEIMHHSMISNVLGRLAAVLSGLNLDCGWAWRAEENAGPRAETKMRTLAQACIDLMSQRPGLTMSTGQRLFVL